jgi:hypothetical protein
MMKKRRRNPHLIESSSSEKTERSKPPKDVLGLGQHLVHELGFDDHRDTLGRWMAHHVAELIQETEKASTPTSRLKARKSASETILKIWEHRKSLPGNAYPLAPYEDVIKVLNLLRPDNNPFSFFKHRPDIKRNQIAADLFDNLSRLVIALLLMNISSRKNSAEASAAAIKALPKTEQDVFVALRQWHDIFVAPPKISGRRGKSKRGSDGVKVNLNEAALQLVGSITTALIELRTELELADEQNAKH